ncbi:vancomycin resistance protein YoaR [Haloactinopolyspora alba]|uniref:Vancomycin resistance protein YoaR n=1 Tax=Haloactinopolyspora alba TaxID=648780 RepID=A0A2P8DXD8_9ACTN|nr:VanW family protein [Haloactinopolyspora alba]PSL01837.1 vancomycin resistance protein YoaR [Haloactinopolyspora alba]
MTDQSGTPGRGAADSDGTGAGAADTTESTSATGVVPDSTTAHDNTAQAGAHGGFGTGERYDTAGGAVPGEPAPDAAPEASPGRRRTLRRVGITAAVVLGVLGVAYGVLYAVAGGSLARGATVAGIDVGGMDPADAEARLTERLPGVVDEPILLSAGGETTYEVVPSEAGLTVDVGATVDAVPGGSANPLSLVDAVLGAGDTTPVPAVDRAAAESAVQGIAERANTDPVNAAVAFEDGEVVTSEPQTGRAVDVEATVQAMIDAYFGDGGAELPIGEVPLAVDEVQPAVDAAELDRAVSEFAEPAMAAPVTVVAGDESVEIAPDVVGQALSMAPDDSGTLRPELDGKALMDVAHDELEEIGQEGKNATVTIEGGEPTVVPGETGQGIAPGMLVDAVLPALSRSGDARQAQVELTEVEPELTTEGAEKLGVTEVISEFTTSFPYAEYRNVNIGTAAESIDDTLLQPGDEFSLNGIVGERTEANGFTSGTIINGGRLVEALGGGVSQVATTTFHAAYKAGLEDVEHWPHSIYFDRYPVGQEATVAWGAKDMRFANDSPYGVVVDTVFTASTPSSDGSLTVRLWSTEHFEVETSLSERHDYTSPRTIYDTSDQCSPQSGSQGFSITSYRKVWNPDGELVKDEADPWTYNPNHQVVCGPEPDEDNNSDENDENNDSGNNDDSGGNDDP